MYESFMTQAANIKGSLLLFIHPIKRVTDQLTDLPIHVITSHVVFFIVSAPFACSSDFGIFAIFHCFFNIVVG